MALPQGINFRATSGFVTDQANEYAEVGDPSNTYPQTTPQGNIVGWTAIMTSRDRNSGNDRRLAGLHRENVNAGNVYRIDLPSAGNYKVGLAAGDANYARSTAVTLEDGPSNPIGTLATGATSSGNNFKDATDTEYSAANWPTSQTLVQFAFTATQLRFVVANTSPNEGPIAHFYVEAVPSSDIKVGSMLVMYQ